MRIVFENATVVNPEGMTEDCTVVVERGKFTRVEPGARVRRGRATILYDASNWLLFPGLINIHDHLYGSWLPRCGNGPYENVYEWLLELHAKPSKFAPARERNRISVHHVYLLGAYKNLLSGVTSVVDHYVRLDPKVYRGLPVRVITEFGREFVVRTYHEPDLFPPWGEGIVDEYKHSVGRLPFIIHVEEGFDEETGTELRRLEKLGVLGPNAVLIHGIGFDDEDIDLVARRKCHMVWCPATHEFLYGRTGNVRAWRRCGINLTLGTDSSLTGGLNLFVEMRTGQQLYRRLFHEDLPLEEILQMVTGNSARALMMEDKIGTIAPGLLADLLVLERQTGKQPLETLLDARPHDVALVLVHGKPKYGDREFQPLFDAAAGNGHLSSVSIHGRPKLLVGDLERLLHGIWDEIGRRYVPEFLPVDASSIHVRR